MSRSLCRKTLNIFTSVLLVVTFTLWLTGPMTLQADEPVARAVLFYSPSCPHCHKVITEDLPPLMEKYDDQLQIVGVNTGTPSGSDLYRTAIEHFEIPEHRLGVPTLIIGDTVLVGSLEIPEQLPELIEKHLAAGGVDWPAIPGFAPPPTPTATAVLSVPLSSTPPPNQTETPPETSTTATDAPPATPSAVSSKTGLATNSTQPASSEAGSDDPVSLNSQTQLGASVEAGVLDKLRRDPVGNGLSIVVLFGMTLSIGQVLTRNEHAWRATVPPDWRGWAIGALAVLGLGVSIYMAYVEVTQVSAVCGPVGDCNTVQQSEYARLFGLVPVGLLGVLGYAAALAAWAGARFGQGRIREITSLGLFGMAVFGTLFSIYLTFLEPFVIGATCAWCLTSAVTMTLILILSTRS